MPLILLPKTEKGSETRTNTGGVTAAADGLEGTFWNVVGHTYTPKMLSESAFVWHAIIPAETFVPPHIHPTQDE